MNSIVTWLILEHNSQYIPLETPCLSDGFEKLINGSIWSVILPRCLTMWLIMTHLLIRESCRSHFLDTSSFPQLKSYDWTANLIDHLETLKMAMFLYGATDAILYRAFPSTLKRVVRHWYFSLKPTSIHSFEQLSQSFIGHFISS